MSERPRTASATPSGDGSPGVLRSDRGTTVASSRCLNGMAAPGSAGSAISSVRVTSVVPVAVGAPQPVPDSRTSLFVARRIRTRMTVREVSNR